MKSSHLIKDKRLQVIFGVTLIAVLGVSSLTPAFPKIAQELKLSEFQVSMLITIFTLPGVFLTPFAGILADRWGRKKVLVPALFLFAMAGFACYFTHDIKHLLFWRFWQGVGASAISSMNITLIGDIFKGPQRAEAMGYNASILSVGTATYPLVGGLLAGLAWNLPFVLPLLALPIGLVVIYMEIPIPHQNEKLRNYLNNAWKSLQKKEIIGIFIISIFTFVILYGTFLSYFPFIMHDKFNLSAPQIGIFMSLSSIFTAITASQLGRLIKRFKESQLLKTAFILYFLVGIIIPQINNLYLFILPVALFGIAQGLNLPSLQTLLANLAPDKQRAAFMSMNGMVLRIGQSIGPLIIGVGFAFGGLQAAFYLSAAIALAVFVMIFWLLKDV